MSEITVRPNREEALEAGFKALSGRISIDFEAFRKALSSWDVKAFCSGGEAVGMLMVKGNELHVAVLPEVRGKWLSRRLIREVIGPLLDKFGHAKTDVMPDNEVGKDFVSRIGFNKGHLSVLRDGFARGTFDPTTALVVAGGQLLGGALSADAAGRASGQQVSADNRASDTQLQMFNTVNSQSAPWRQAGQNALRLIGAGLPGGGGTNVGPGMEPLTSDQVNQLYMRYLGRLPAASELANTLATTPNARALEGGFVSNPEFQARGVGAPERIFPDTPQPAQEDLAAQGGFDPGYFTHQFNANDLNENLAPNWKFGLEQGQGAAKNALNLTNGLGGNFAKGLVDYTVNKSGDLYQQAYNNYTNNQQSIFNRLTNIAGLGQNANQITAQAGTTTAQNVGNAQMAAGAAQAAGTVGSANALSGGISNAASWYALPQILKSGSGGGGAPIDPSLLAG